MSASNGLIKLRHHALDNQLRTPWKGHLCRTHSLRWGRFREWCECFRWECYPSASSDCVFFGTPCFGGGSCNDNSPGRHRIWWKPSAVWMLPYAQFQSRQRSWEHWVGSTPPIHGTQTRFPMSCHLTLGRWSPWHLVLQHYWRCQTSRQHSCRLYYQTAHESFHPSDPRTLDKRSAVGDSHQCYSACGCAAQRAGSDHWTGGWQGVWSNHMTRRDCASPPG